MTNVRHVLGISGGKDSAALAIYLRTKYPELEIEYYFMDTGKELDETYEFIDALEVFLGQRIARLQAASGSPVDPFDHYLGLYGGYLPSPTARWCTRKLKLEPFERDFVGDDPVISYVAIRGDEDREGYISHRSNIQTVFPFRRNIWSKDITSLVLADENVEQMVSIYANLAEGKRRDAAIKLVERPTSIKFNLVRKLNVLLDFDVPLFNHAVYTFLQGTDYCLSQVPLFPLLDNDDSVDRDGVFKLLDMSGVGKPKYYQPIELEVNGQKGFYNRSRSGCYFCFFQQKIEWVWLYEQHPERFREAMNYEKEGFAWMDDERLEDLIQPERIENIKEAHLASMAVRQSNGSSFLTDILSTSEGEGCTVCFV